MVVRIVNVSKGTTVSGQLRKAESLWARFVGLMGRRRLEEGEGLLLAPCSSVHTFFMRFPIDVIFMDREGKVVKVAPALRPFRLALGGRGARDAVEVTAGTAARADTAVGDRLAVEDDCQGGKE
ncbi:MAG: hypothetical protein AMJ76_01370 [Dehalococcoidia bacterium SM23_28_1]|nr:MAG: hypothetical protein AMJ76_01370 [Dehalococcoidia bacterium SM23_28_1]